MYTPANSLQRVSFYTLARVEKVQLKGEEIVGCFADALMPFNGLNRIRLFEEFPNWQNDAASILRFTRCYGPLEEKPERGQDFRFALEEWRSNQEGFRLLWSMAQSPELPGLVKQAWGRVDTGRFDTTVEFDVGGNWFVCADAGEGWGYANGVLAYRPANLFRLLVFHLLSCPRERLRKCLRPDCPHPYFAARHLKQNYCSEPCARLAQKQWKQRWWSEHGNEWRARQQKRVRQKKDKRAKRRGR